MNKNKSMAQFKRSRLERKSEEQITKKTVFLGFLSIISFLLIVVFGLPLLIKFSIFLGDIKNKGVKDQVEKVLPPLEPRLILPYEATNSGQIKIEGVAQAGVEVELLKDDVTIGKTQVSEEGDFVFDNVVLDEGENAFSSRASIKDGGTSDLSKLVIIIYDDTSPRLEMTNPKEEALTIDYSDFDVVGNTDKNSSVTINGRFAMVDDNGEFKLKIQLAPGKNDIEIISKDMAGNETKKKIVITYDI
jgi:hypothetical protein